PPWIYSNHFAPVLKMGLYPERYPALGKALKFAIAFVSLAYLATACPREVFDSHENEQRIARYFPWARKKFMTIYHSGLEGQPPKAGFRQPVVTIGNLGHIGHRKGQQDLLEAFCLLLPRFPNLELLLVGPDGEDGSAQSIRAELAEKGLAGRVHLPGGLTEL